MAFFDTRTVMVCYALISLICAAVMAMQWGHYRGRYAGLGFWLVGYALQCLGLVLIMARGFIPDILSLTLGNAMIVGGFVLLLRGVRLFFGMGGRSLLDWAVFALFIVAHALYVAVLPDLSAREIVFCLALLFVCLRGIRVAARIEPGLRGLAAGIVLVLVAFCLASLVRIALNLAMPGGEDFFASPSYDSILIVAYMSLFSALTFSLVAVVGRRAFLEQERVIDEKVRAEASLRASEEKFSKAFQASPDAVALSRMSDGRFIEINDSFCRISGYSREEVLGSPAIDVWGDSEARRALIEKIRGASLVKGHEATVIGKFGKAIRAEISGGLVELEGVKHLLTIVRDLAERDRAAAILRVRLTLREYSVDHSIEELMTKALDEIETMTGSVIGFYHFIDEDQGLLTRQAWSTRTLRDFCGAVGGESHYPIGRAGVWADCVRERRPVVHNDYPSLPHRHGLPDGHLAIRRELVAPTLRDGKIVAILGVGNKPSDYDEKDVSLVSYIVDLVWTIVLQKRSDERILELNGRLEQLAMTDELTGIANRRAFLAYSLRETQRANRYSAPLSFLMIDIDRFKLVNDDWGHDSGDAVLKMVAEVIRGHVRDVDIPARLGGEEFGILMPNTVTSDAALSAERLRAAIAESSCDYRGRCIRVSVSIGIGSKSERAADLDAIMRAADEAMYLAKASGRNRVETA